MKRCVIVGAGEIYSEIDVREGDVVIAADGGYKYLCDADLKPDVLIGDFDSLGELPSLENVKIVKHPIEKDETDMYLAYTKGVERGYTDFIIYGGAGGRDDHTFANYSLLIHAIMHGHRVKLVGERFDIFAIKDEHIVLFGKVGATLSVFAFGSDARGVTLEGVKYSVEGITLTPHFPLGVSNSFTKPRARIGVDDGVLLIMKER